MVLDTLDDQLDPVHTALLLVDIQNDFLHADGVLGRADLAGFLDMSMVPGMTANARRLLRAARSRDILTVFIQNIGDDKYTSDATRALMRRRGRPGSGATLEGTWGADFFDDIRPDGVSREVVVRKHRYSAFIGTNLDLVLRSHNIRTLVMTGDATSGCVESTTRDGFFHDYYVVTVGDACADFSRERHEASLAKMDLSFGYVVPTDAVLTCWKADARA